MFIILVVFWKSSTFAFYLIVSVVKVGGHIAGFTSLSILSSVMELVQYIFLSSDRMLWKPKL